MEISKRDLAWAAGFFDGEGCTYFRTQHRDRYYKSANLELSLGQKDHKVIDKWIRIFGVGTVHCYENKYGVVYQWKASTFQNSQYIMSLIWSDLGEVKKDQYLEAARKYLDSRKDTRKQVQWRKTKSPKDVVLVD